MKTLKGKISLIIIGLIFLIAIIGITSGITLFIIEKLVDGLMTDNYKSIRAIASMTEALERQDSAMHIYMSMDRAKGIAIFEENRIIFQKWHNIEINNITEAGEKELVEKIDADYNNYLQFFHQLQEILNTKGQESSAQYYGNSISPVFNGLKTNFMNLIMINENAMFRDKEMASSTSKRSIYFILIFSSFVLISGFTISRYFTNRFLAPLRLLQEGIKKVKADELDQHIDIYSNDEIAVLAKEFNEMTLRLKQYEKSNIGNLLIEKNKSLAIVKSISDPLLVLDVNYRITLINAACENFFNIKEKKVLNKHFLEAIRNGTIFDHFSIVEESSQEHLDKIIKVTKDKEYYFNVLVTSVKDSEGSTSGIIVLMQNVTELKELEHIKTDFIATISHEFKTPLTSILMGASLLEDGSFGHLTAEQIEVLRGLKDDAEKLTSLVIDLLELSKIESKGSIYNYENCDISSIFQYSLKQFIDLAQKKEVSILIDLANDLPKVYADFEKISWVVNNLMSNALKHTRSGDSITLRASQAEKLFQVSVIDTGDGIPLDIIDTIFDKFSSDKNRDIETRGSGFGLSSAKDIVNAHHGEIWVKSILGEGSSFTFTLPL